MLQTDSVLCGASPHAITDFEHLAYAGCVVVRSCAQCLVSGALNEHALGGQQQLLGPAIQPALLPFFPTLRSCRCRMAMLGPTVNGECSTRGAPFGAPAAYPSTRRAQRCSAWQHGALQWCRTTIQRTLFLLSA